MFDFHRPMHGNESDMQLLTKAIGSDATVAVLKIIGRLILTHGQQSFTGPQNSFSHLERHVKIQIANHIRDLADKGELEQNDSPSKMEVLLKDEATSLLNQIKTLEDQIAAQDHQLDEAVEEAHRNRNQISALIQGRLDADAAHAAEVKELQRQIKSLTESVKTLTSANSNLHSLLDKARSKDGKIISCF